MAESEQALWDILESHEIPFRETAAHLLDAFGYYDDGWRKHGRIASQDLIVGLSTPFIFNINERRSQMLAPARFSGYLRDSDDWATNYRQLVQTVINRFGAGIEGSASNTQETRWNFGKASVVVRVFPPELNQSFGRNDRHDLVPNSAIEASVTITPNWCKPATPQVIDWATHCNRMHPESSRNFAIMAIDFACQIEADQNGFGVTDDGLALLKFDPERVSVVETSWVTAVRYDRLLPAKGGGGIYLSMNYENANETGNLQLLWTSSEDDIPMVQQLADTLTNRLDVPLETSEAYDC